MQFQDTLRITQRHLLTSRGSPITTVYHIVLITQLFHQRMEPFGNICDSMFFQLFRESESGNRGNNNVIPRLNERMNHRNISQERIGPTVNQQNCTKILWALLMKGVQLFALYCIDAMLVRVQYFLMRRPIVLGKPIIHEIFHKLDRDSCVILLFI